jgi:hypothetical protein
LLHHHLVIFGFFVIAGEGELAFFTIPAALWLCGVDTIDMIAEPGGVNAK